MVLLNHPTAVQLPAETQETDLRVSLGLAFCISAPNVAGTALAQVPFVCVCVKASVWPAAFLNLPTAVQLPSDGHDTEKSTAAGLVFCTPVPNIAGLASAQVPLVWVCVNATELMKERVRKLPTAVQLPGEEQEIELKPLFGLEAN